MNTQFGLTLNKLSLKNFATFSDQDIEFSTEFNAIIGETGSGKSLILDALQLILGHRADKRLVRKGAEFAIVESIFHCSDKKIQEYFFELGYPYEDNEVTIKRIIYKNGKSKSYLNHQSCSLATLSEFSRQFIDLVGQFENQKLLSETYQLSLLDNYLEHERLISAYSDTFNELIETQKQLDLLKEKNSQVSQRLDYLNYQINEITVLSPSVEDENDLKTIKTKLQNFETRQLALAQINSIFEGSDYSNGLTTSLTKLENLLQDNLIDTQRLTDFQIALETINDLNYHLNSEAGQEFDEQELEEVITRLDSYQKLKRKFNVDTTGLVSLLSDFSTEKEELDNMDKNVSILEERLIQLQLNAFTQAKTLHESRLAGSEKLSNTLSTAIQSLRMEGATIRIDLSENSELSKSGISQIKLMAETNPGEGFFKVKDSASGGELSRILLAIRKVLASKDSISIFLFDEIDTGIGGETALCIGSTLEGVARNSQVIAITHLPQIANFAQKLIIVSKEQIKENSKDRTISQVREVMGKQLKDEVISMTPLN